jgi:hypothetical protein
VEASPIPVLRATMGANTGGRLADGRRQHRRQIGQIPGEAVPVGEVQPVSRTDDEQSALLP